MILTWLKQYEIYQIFTQLYDKNILTTIFNLSLAVLFLLEVIFIIRINFDLNRIDRKIRNRRFHEDSFLEKLLVEFKEKAFNQFSINTGTFINAFFAREKGSMVRIIKFIKKSDSLFVLLGFLWAFILILSALLNLNFEGLQGLRNILPRLQVLLESLRLGFYSISVGIICGIMVNIVNKIWVTVFKIEDIKAKLEEYLENEVKPPLSNDTRQIEAINNLISTLENGVTKLEDVMEDVFVESITDLEEIIRSKQNKEKLPEELKFLREIDFSNKEVYQVIKQIAAFSNNNKLLDYNSKNKKEA